MCGGIGRDYIIIGIKRYIKFLWAYSFVNGDIMNIRIVRDVAEENIPTQGYPVFSIDGTRMDLKGYDPKIAGPVYFLLENMYKNKGLGGLSTEKEIMDTIKEGVNGHGTPSIVDVAKKFPDDIANYLMDTIKTN